MLQKNISLITFVRFAHFSTYPPFSLSPSAVLFRSCVYWFALRGKLQHNEKEQPRGFMENGDKYDSFMGPSINTLKIPSRSAEDGDAKSVVRGFKSEPRVGAKKEEEEGVAPRPDENGEAGTIPRSPQIYPDDKFDSFDALASMDFGDDFYDASFLDSIEEEEEERVIGDNNDNLDTACSQAPVPAQRRRAGPAEATEEERVLVINEAIEQIDKSRDRAFMSFVMEWLNNKQSRLLVDAAVYIYRDTSKTGRVKVDAMSKANAYQNALLNITQSVLKAIDAKNYETLVRLAPGRVYW